MKTTPYYYQSEAVNAVFDYFMGNEGAPIVCIPGMNRQTSKEIYEKEFFELCFKEEQIKSVEIKEIQKDKKEIKKLKGMI